MPSAKPRRARRARGSIDAAMILEGAFDVARGVGLEGMSMPLLAESLNVGVTSIYWYFRNKEALLQQMYATASESLSHQLTPQITPEPQAWRAHLLDLFQKMHMIYSHDALLAELVLHSDGGHSGVVSENAYDLVDANISLLIQAGFQPITAWQVWSTLAMFTHGIASNERARTRSGYPPPGKAQLTMLNPSSQATITRLVTDHDISIDGTGGTFVPGLNLILDAAAQLLVQDQAESA